MTSIHLEITKRTDPRLLDRMKNHYSKPKGFVGRNICYAVMVADDYYGHIIAGSATRFLPGRNEFLGVSLEDINKVVNNIFFNVRPCSVKYPERNFTSKTVKVFEEQVIKDWFNKYGDEVVGFETLIEKPRTGELYRRAGWALVGETKGFTCKRVSGKGTDSWSGRRVWNTDKDQLRPKNVYCKRISHR